MEAEDMENSIAPPWVELPPDITSSILQKVGPIEMLKSADKVCSTWRRLCHEPAMWRVVKMQNAGADFWDREDDLEKICGRAVECSNGELVDLSLEYFGSDKLLSYIAERSPQLKHLRLVCSYNVSAEGLSAAVKKFPLLEELHLFYIAITKEAIETIGSSCRGLKSFKLNNQICRHPYSERDEEAKAIAQNMPELHHLQLLGNKMTNGGLEAILNGCPQLESLDLRRCLTVNLLGEVGKRYFRQFKSLRPPQDPAEDYGPDTEMHDYGSFDEDYELSDGSNYSDDDEMLFE
ncbi:F-box protein SKIP19-like isoform X2 [Solanum tuberosum]|uniref:F-box protein SKIP19-like isoform X2 n=1 Tax=Solanum tuberosum TaxID=4113 RepID=UPI00073A1528|nr:PREDICTED: F-box protein SKIP19-like isoform X2 [Solanum tuberosum]